MTKQENIYRQDSCWNKARDDEPIFIILGRDRASLVAIDAWCNERIKLGLNHRDDPQTIEAMQCAIAMMHYRERIKPA